MTPFVFAVVLASLGPVDEVPFRIGDDAIIVDVTVNGRSASLMYDTGFGGSVVLAENLDIGKATGTMNLRDFVGQFEAKTVPIKSMKIGQRTVTATGMDAVQQPDDSYTMAYGTHCDGILGMEPFGRSVFEINFEKQKLVFHPDSLDISKRAPDNVTTFSAKLLPKGVNSMELSVEVPGGEKLHMALDTGNSGYAVTHKDALERVKVWPEGKKPNFMAQSVVASGPVDTFYVGLKDLKIYGVPVPQCVFGVIDLPSSSADHDGTIGFGFLKNFNITIDLLRRRVWLENFTGKVTEDIVGDVGVLAFVDRKRKRMRVFSVMPGSPAEKAGVKYGDDLLGIDGQEIGTLGFRKVLALLRGQVGSKVKLEFSRDGQLIRHELERAHLVNSVN